MKTYLLLFCVLSLSYVAGTASATQSAHPRTGTRGTFTPANTDHSFMAHTYRDIRHTMRYLDRKDQTILRTMVSDGRLTEIEPGSPLRVMRYHNTYVKIRIIDGPQKNKTGWIPATWATYEEKTPADDADEPEDDMDEDEPDDDEDIDEDIDDEEVDDDTPVVKE